MVTSGAGGSGPGVAPAGHGAGEGSGPFSQGSTIGYLFWKEQALEPPAQPPNHEGNPPRSLAHCACACAEPCPSWVAGRQRSGRSTQLGPAGQRPFSPFPPAALLTSPRPLLGLTDEARDPTSRRSPGLPGASLRLIRAFLMPTLPVPAVRFRTPACPLLAGEFPSGSPEARPGPRTPKERSQCVRDEPAAPSLHGCLPWAGFWSGPHPVCLFGGLGQPHVLPSLEVGGLLLRRKSSFSRSPNERGEGEGGGLLPPIHTGACTGEALAGLGPPGWLAPPLVAVRMATSFRALVAAGRKDSGPFLGPHAQGPSRPG